MLSERFEMTTSAPLSGKVNISIDFQPFDFHNGSFAKRNLLSK